MRTLVIALAMGLLSGCWETVPERKFPEAPKELLVECQNLSMTPIDTTQLSVVVSIAVENYGYSNVCKLKVEAWISWYNKQKKIFESVDKNGRP